MAVHTNSEGLQASEREEAVHRSGHGAYGVLEKRDIGDPVLVTGGHESTDHVGVTSDVFGRRVDDQVGAEGQWLLQVWRSERVVDDKFGPVFMGNGCKRLDIEDGQQGIGRRLDPDDAGRRVPCFVEQRGLCQVGCRPLHAASADDLRDQSKRAAVGVVAEHDVIAGLQ